MNKAESPGIAFRASSNASIKVDWRAIWKARSHERTIMIFHRIHPNPEIQSHLDQAVELRAEFIRACFRSFARWGARWFHVSRSILWLAGPQRRRPSSIAMLVAANDEVVPAAASFNWLASSRANNPNSVTHEEAENDSATNARCDTHNAG